jgi:hypothetical protein
MNFMPLATIGQEPVFANDRDTMAALVSPRFDPRKTVYLPSEARHLVSTPGDAEARLLSSRVTAHRLLFETEAKAPALLTVAQTYYHLWKARVDGRETPLLRANYGFQAVQVPPGRHRVQLVYEDVNFYWGAVLSAVTLLGCIAALWRLRKPRRVKLRIALPLL